MEPVDNNIFEVKPDLKGKRKRILPSTNAFLNPALDLLANEDPMCNNAMEITPNKRRKRTKSCDVVAFENTALDLGISRAAVNEFLLRELENVRKNARTYESPMKINSFTNNVTNNYNEPLYANLTEISNAHSTVTIDSINKDHTFDSQNSIEHCATNTTGESYTGISILEQKSLNSAISTEDDQDATAMNKVTNVHANVTNQIFIGNTSNLNLSFINRLALDSPCGSNQSLYLDDDLNESNIMEIKTITIVTKKKRIQQGTCTNPFLDPNFDTRAVVTDENPFLDVDTPKSEIEYNLEVLNRPIVNPVPSAKNVIPRTLFVGDTNGTISTVNESSTDIESNDYENIDSYRSDSPIYEDIGEEEGTGECENVYNKQSKILGHDVSRFSASDIKNLNRYNSTDISTESSGSRKDLERIFKVGNKLSKRFFKTLRKTFTSGRVEQNATLNPYEVPRKPQKQKAPVAGSGIENPALNLDNSDDMDIEVTDDVENHYENVRTLRNTRLNMNVTPLKERVNDTADLSSARSNTPGKKVRFDSTLNREKIITGDSFNCDVQSPGIDAKIDTYHDELENCINERKSWQQNM